MAVVFPEGDAIDQIVTTSGTVLSWEGPMGIIPAQILSSRAGLAEHGKSGNGIEHMVPTSHSLSWNHLGWKRSLMSD